MARYIVTAGYATVLTAVPGGRAWVDIPRGAELPADVPADMAAALVARGHVQELSEPTPEVGPELEVSLVEVDGALASGPAPEVVDEDQADGPAPTAEPEVDDAPTEQPAQPEPAQDRPVRKAGRRAAARR